MSTVELIADYACLTGENPLWHPAEKRLYWCDIPRGRMFRYDPATGKHEPCYQGEHLGAKLVAKFAPVTAQRVRLNITDATDGPTICEFQLFAPAP